MGDAAKGIGISRKKMQRAQKEEGSGQSPRHRNHGGGGDRPALRTEIPSPRFFVLVRFFAADHRSVTRITSFKPDQISSTAHTLTSTRVRGSAMSRITFSVMSVGTFDAFLGQDTHMTSLDLICFR